MVETIFVPRGAEERAVRSALGRSTIRVVATAIGARGAARAADAALAEANFGNALVTGLCGALSPSFVVGDVLVYDEIRSSDGPALVLERDFALGLARRIPGSLTGIRATHSDRIVTRASDKYALAIRTGADVVDMESYALVDRLSHAGVSVGVVRIASDAARDDLPDLDRALDGSGGIDDAALALAFARAPLASARLISSAVKSLRALRAAIAALVAAN